MRRPTFAELEERGQDLVRTSERDSRLIAEEWQTVERSLRHLSERDAASRRTYSTHRGQGVSVAGGGKDTKIQAAYEFCQKIARDSGTGFYAGMRLISADKRTALFAIYALARRIDDLVDEDNSVEAKLTALEHVCHIIRHLDEADDPVFVAVADAARRFPIPVDAISELVEGAKMDILGHRYETFADTELYGRRVAGSIGRLALGIFETPDRPTAEQLAVDLGVGLQLTNILRDLSTDLPAGYVYIPATDLARFGCRVLDGQLVGPAEQLVAFEARRALEFVDKGLGIVPLLDRRSAACVLAMAGSYRRLLARIGATPEIVLHRQPSEPTFSRWDVRKIEVRRRLVAA